MHVRTPLVAVLALFVAAGCDQQPVEPDTEVTASTPSFKFEDAPTFSGVVVRGEFPNAWTWVDGRSGLRLVIGADPLEFCAGTVAFDLIQFQDIYPRDRYLGQVQGEDMQATVWPFTSFSCALFTSVPPVASGVADFIYTDNSFSGVGPNDDFANAWGYRAHGTLSYTDGGAPASFSAHLNMKYNNSTGYSETSKISLN